MWNFFKKEKLKISVKRDGDITVQSNVSYGIQDDCHESRSGSRKTRSCPKRSGDSKVPKARKFSKGTPVTSAQRRECPDGLKRSGARQAKGSKSCGGSRHPRGTIEADGKKYSREPKSCRASKYPRGPKGPRGCNGAEGTKHPTIPGRTEGLEYPGSKYPPFPRRAEGLEYPASKYPPAKRAESLKHPRGSKSCGDSKYPRVPNGPKYPEVSKCSKVSSGYECTKCKGSCKQASYHMPTDIPMKGGSRPAGRPASPDRQSHKSASAPRSAAEGELADRKRFEEVFMQRGQRGIGSKSEDFKRMSREMERFAREARSQWRGEEGCGRRES